MLIRRISPALVRSLPFALPIFAIALARVGTFTQWAASNPQLAALLFAWIVVDALALGLLAKAPGHKPTLYQVVAVLALSSLVVFAGASGPVREIYLGLPLVLTALGLTVALFLTWSAARFAMAYHGTGSARAAAEAVLPPLLVHFLISELRIVHLALFRWGAPADVPAGSAAYPYHTYLTPMIATFVALQLIELAVVHFLLLLWNPTVAWIMFGLSAWGVIWTVALLKSFRINPVLLSDEVIRARSGFVYDVTVPRSAIADCERGFTSEELKDKAILNLAIMSSPNVSLRFAQPLSIPTLFGGKREISGVALRLEDSAAFLAELKHSGRPNPN